MFAVRRNEYGPEFTNSLYQKEISENYPLGEEIVAVRARDNDVVCIREGLFFDGLRLDDLKVWMISLV